MKISVASALLPAIAMLVIAGHAQPQPQAQNSPGRVTPGGGGPPAGKGMGMHGGAQNTYGWSLMTTAERQEHMAKMSGFTRRADCQAYVAEHHRLMTERAKQRGVSMPAEPRQDQCAGLK